MHRTCCDFAPAASSLTCKIGNMLQDDQVVVTHQVCDDVVVTFDVFPHAHGLQGDTQMVKQHVFRPSRGVSMINN